jgi:7-cyano-7-deazaguanine synthase
MASNIDSSEKDTKEKSVILFSGGVDSLIGWFRMGMPDLLHVEIHHRYHELEVTAVNSISSTYPELGGKLKSSQALKGVGQWEKKDAEIPARNLMLAIAAAQYGYNRIGLVCQLDERSIPDRSNDFFIHASTMLSSLFGRGIQLDPVFPDMDKTDMIRWFLDGFPLMQSERDRRIELLKKTVACYTPVERGTGLMQCGECPACFRRVIAFELNDVRENYAQNPYMSAVAMMYWKMVQAGKYTGKRAERITEYLRIHERVKQTVDGLKWWTEVRS